MNISATFDIEFINNLNHLHHEAMDNTGIVDSGKTYITHIVDTFNTESLRYSIYEKIGCYRNACLHTMDRLKDALAECPAKYAHSPFKVTLNSIYDLLCEFYEETEWELL